MIASKLTITNETREKLLNPALSPQKKKALRQELIVDRIRRSMSGACTKQELIAAAGFDVSNARDYAKGFNLIERMVKRKIIAHNQSTSYRKFWTITADVRTHRIPKEAPVVSPTPEQVALSVLPKEVLVELQEPEQLTSIKLVEMAKEFAWKNNSDSLRDFIQYAEKAVK